MRILVADDDHVSSMVLCKYLGKYGTCDVASEGVNAIDLFYNALKDKDCYDLICLDIMMPKVDGIKVLKTIRDIEAKNGILKDKQVKVIMTTVLFDSHTIIDCYATGCNAYIWKPIDFDKFFEALRSLKLIE